MYSEIFESTTGTSGTVGVAVTSNPVDLQLYRTRAVYTVYSMYIGTVVRPYVRSCTVQLYSCMHTLPS